MRFTFPQQCSPFADSSGANASGDIHDSRAVEAVRRVMGDVDLLGVLLRTKVETVDPFQENTH